jgi:hypothetical protein
MSTTNSGNYSRISPAQAWLERGLSSAIIELPGPLLPMVFMILIHHWAFIAQGI